MASFAVGDVVDCLADAGAAWAPYRVARVRPDRRVDLFSADGARLHRVDPRRLRRRGTAAATTTDTPRARGPASADATTPDAEASRDGASPRAAGRRVAVAFHGGRRRCGEVLRRGRCDERRHVVAAGAAPNARARYEVGAEGPLRFDVAYDEGGVERGVAGDRVRPLSPADDTAAAADDAGAGTLPAETLRARWRRRRDDAAADPAPAADDARPWPRFARCAVLLDGEWRRGAVTSRRPGFLLVALDGARPGAPAVAASYDQVLRLPDAHEAPGAAAAPAAAPPDLRAGSEVVVADAAGGEKSATVTRCRLDGTLDVAFADGGTRDRVAPGDVAAKTGGRPRASRGPAGAAAPAVAPAVAARVRAALAAASRGAPGGVRWCLAPLARGGRVDRRAVEALLGRHGLAEADAAELWAAAGGDDLEGLARFAAADGAESRSAASAIDALRHELRRCAARADGTIDAAAVFREAAAGRAAVDVGRLLDRVGARLGSASRRAVAARLDRRGDGRVDEADFVAFVRGEDEDEDGDDASSSDSPPRETGRLADDWDDLFAGGNTYSVERDVASDDDGEREERRRAALRHLRRGLGAWLETPRYRAQLRRCPRDAGEALECLRLGLTRRDLDACAREFAAEAPLGPSVGRFMAATAAWAEGALAELGSAWAAGPAALCAAVGALRDLPRGALLDDPAALEAAGVAPPPGDRAFLRTLERLADAEPLGRALPRPRRENPGELTVGAAVTVNGATGTIECVRPNGRVDVALAAGQTLAGVRRGDVTFAGQDVSVVADAAVPPPVRWKERRAAHTDAGPPPWATAPKKRGVRERRS